MEPNVLDDILRNARGRVEILKELPHIDKIMERQALEQPPHRGFIQALREANSKPALIAECKQASPSEGRIRLDYDPVTHALDYERAGARCLSVLTEPSGFLGDEADLIDVRYEVELPVIRKDFILDEFDVRKSSSIGADCILLIVAILDQHQLSDFYQQAIGLGMDVLVEVHTEREAERAMEIGATMIGVNNRNLNTFRTDLAATEQILPLLGPDVLKVSESGLKTRDDVIRVRDAGADAVLIGTTFMRQADLVRAVQELMPW